MKKPKASKAMEALREQNVSLKQQVRGLKSKIRKLQNKNVKLETDYFSAQAEVRALKKLKVPPKPKPMSNIETARRIAFILNRGGYEFVDGKVVKVRAARGAS